MKNKVLAKAVALSDDDLFARIEALAGAERETTAELVAHLAALELRPDAFAARGYGSLFDYCTQTLRLSEDAACTRIRAARTCRSFPVVLDLLSSGAVSLTTVRLLQPHLTAENHQAVLARAANKPRTEINALVAELAPQPDVPASVRKLPASATSAAFRAGTAADLRDGDAQRAVQCDVHRERWVGFRGTTGDGVRATVGRGDAPTTEHPSVGSATVSRPAHDRPGDA